MLRTTEVSTNGTSCETATQQRPLPRCLHLKLSDVQRETLRLGLARLVCPGGPDYEDFLDEARGALFRHLPRELLRSIGAVKSNPDPPGLLVIENLPVDELGPTPADGRRSPFKRTSCSEAFLLGVASLLGEPLTFDVEKGMDLVHDVCPVRGSERELTNRGSAVDLGFHTERAAFDTDRWLLLWCNRADHDRVAVTPVADIRDALPHLEPEVVAELRKPHYRFRVPYIFDAVVPPEARLSDPGPVLSGPESCAKLRVALYGDVTQVLTPDAGRALDRLGQALGRVARNLRLESGNMVILSNHLVAHGRSSFAARFDGSDRWLQRVHVAESLWPIRAWQRDSVRVLSL
jgi:L-asparagine oxygenase